MIHDAQVEVTCDGVCCNESIYVDLPYRYDTLSGGGGHYVSDDEEIEDLAKSFGWVCEDGKHYCSEECGDD